MLPESILTAILNDLAAQTKQGTVRDCSYVGREGPDEAEVIRIDTDTDAARASESH